MCDEHFYVSGARERLHKMFYGLKIPCHGFICHTQSMAVSKGVVGCVEGFYCNDTPSLLVDVCSIGRQTFSLRNAKRFATSAFSSA
jgi:hypothetical protein